MVSSLVGEIGAKIRNWGANSLNQETTLFVKDRRTRNDGNHNPWNIRRPS